MYLSASATPSSNCVVTAYDKTSGTVTFTATLTETGVNKLYIRLTAPLAGLTHTTTLSADASYSYFVDAAGSTYSMPTSLSLSPTSVVEAAPTTLTLTTIGATHAVSAPIALFYTTQAGTTAQLGAGTLAGNTATVAGVSLPLGTWTLALRVTSPLGAGTMEGDTGMRLS